MAPLVTTQEKHLVLVGRRISFDTAQPLWSCALGRAFRLSCFPQLLRKINEIFSQNAELKNNRLRFSSVVGGRGQFEAKSPDQVDF